MCGIRLLGIDEDLYDGLLHNLQTALQSNQGDESFDQVYLAMSAGLTLPFLSSENFRNL